MLCDVSNFTQRRCLQRKEVRERTRQLISYRADRRTRNTIAGYSRPTIRLLYNFRFLYMHTLEQKPTDYPTVGRVAHNSTVHGLCRPMAHNQPSYGDRGPMVHSHSQPNCGDSTQSARLVVVQLRFVHSTSKVK